tara:strand:- start:41 stop:484 length:444 start_codon:yes stop_codon:yes gene_type:complete
MTVREAVELVLQASTLAIRPSKAPISDSGKLYVLDMGEPIKILSLAHQIIRLSGLRPDIDVAIKYVGLRAGEKLSEQLFHESETLMPTEHESIRLASARLVELSSLRKRLNELSVQAESRNVEPTLTILKELVPEFICDSLEDAATQ